MKDCRSRWGNYCCFATLLIVLFSTSSVLVECRLCNSNGTTTAATSSSSRVVAAANVGPPTRIKEEIVSPTHTESSESTITTKQQQQQQEEEFGDKQLLRNHTTVSSHAHQAQTASEDADKMNNDGSTTTTSDQRQARKTEATSSASDYSSTSSSSRPNLLFIMTDQQRFDALRRAQDELSDYDGTLKIRTPNLDRLAERGVYFRNAYCGCPSCAPARAILRTGNTMERTGVQANNLDSFKLMGQFAKKIRRCETYEQVLVQQRGYVAETYGKWHVPNDFYFAHHDRNKTNLIISYNDYDFQKSQFELTRHVNWKGQYKKSLQYLARVNHLHPAYREGEQTNPFSDFPYDPIQVDPRYMAPTNSATIKGEQGKVAGRDSLSSKFSTTTVLGKMALRALSRLAATTTNSNSKKKLKQPFSLTISFSNPHPPMVAAPEYYDYYNLQRSQLLVPPSLRDPMKDSAYADSTRRKSFSKVDIQQWTGVYYALVEEVDHWIGRLLDALKTLQLDKNTLVIFTSDHGEMLGAHSLKGKSKFYEEASRVPLLMAFPGKIASNLTVKEPVMHMDVFATILDYLGASHLDQSDGTSLRRYIERTNFNKQYDDEFAVSEREPRVPKDNKHLTGKLGSAPNFMVRKRNYKLMLPKKANSEVLDMMYDLGSDPYETKNLLGSKGQKASPQVIGKAEHLKILLIEWMKRHDGKQRYYSNNKWNLGEGRGDIAEVRKRRTWKALNFWMSDQKIKFGNPVQQHQDGPYRWNEYLYIGRTRPGVLSISSISVTGPGSRFFKVSKKKARIKKDSYIRIKVKFRSPKPVSIKSLNASIKVVLANDKRKVHTVEIKGET